MTLEYILNNLQYDLIIDGNTKFHGNIDYVTEHIADGRTNTLKISDNQPSDILDFVRQFKKAQEKDPSLSIEKFYESKGYLS